MQLIRTLAFGTFVIHCSIAQIFPFSNLRAFFDHKTVVQGNGAVDQKKSPSRPHPVNFSRPYRQTENDGLNPPVLPEFDSPDIFTINRDIGGDRNYPVVRQAPNYTPTEVEPVTRPPKRRGSSSRYRIVTQPSQEDSVFITPQPNDFVFKQAEEDVVAPFTKLKPKTRLRAKKPTPPPAQDLEQYVDTSELDTSQITPAKDLITLPFSNSNKPQVHQQELTSPSEEDSFIEKVPALGVAIEENNFDQSDGLVDYLVPPNLPSVYEKNLKPKKSRDPAVSDIIKRKPPPPPSVQPVPIKKDPRYRLKKRRNELKSTSVPLPERTTSTTKRQISRRRPSHPRERPHPRPGDIPPRQIALQKQATEMDEQITAETGFTDGSHHPSLNGGERVEFQMHGQKGPQSYKFGYDTGKGHNRQFRFEEKDGHGRVKGHYGFYDKHGKLQVINYEADHTGFKADNA